MNRIILIILSIVIFGIIAENIACKQMEKAVELQHERLEKIDEIAK